MQLWRLSTARHSRDFSGGYGLLHSGRWNTPGRPITYCSTVPSLTALEKRVHVTDPSLLPPLMLVEYEAPDDIPLRAVDFADLSDAWIAREVDTQQIGDQWLDTVSEALLTVPSAIVPVSRAPERNVLINHRHVRSAEIKIVNVTPFTLDPRLFQR
jgi:RES domain-containing protein